MFLYRDNVESAHGDEIALLRSQYSDEDKKMIEKCLQAKRTIRQEEPAQHRMVEETDQDSSSGKMINIVIMYYLSLYSMLPQCT